MLRENVYVEFELPLAAYVYSKIIIQFSTYHTLI
jgi:hypothetical protein